MATEWELSWLISQLTKEQRAVVVALIRELLKK